MYKIKIKQGESVQELEFESAKLAKIYKDYHIAFGNWKNVSRWVEEKDVHPEIRRFIVDEKTDLVNGVIKRSYLVTDGIEIECEIASDNAITQSWEVYRETRNMFLKESDWTQLADSPLSQEEKSSWRKYRTYLRNSPKLHNDETIAGATPSSFEEWKQGRI